MDVNNPQFVDYDGRDELLLYKGKLLLDPTSSLISLVLRECHSTPIVGHGGIQKTIARVSASFTWNGLKKNAQKFVKEFAICQKNEAFQSSCLRINSAITCSKPNMGILGNGFHYRFTNFRGLFYHLVVVDRLSKQAHFGALPKSYMAQRVAHLFFHYCLQATSDSKVNTV